MLPRIAVACLLVVLTAAPAAAAGLVIPDEPDLPPLALERHVVRVDVDRQAATTVVEQTFRNNTQRRLEAQYVFPIPKGAVVSRFVMSLNGRDVKGELVGKEKARRIYESAVQRSGDAGLLEYLGGEVFRARLFPVEPDRELRISVRFQQVLPAENDLVHYVYPLRDAPKRGPTVHGEFRLEATIKSSAAIRNVYSPSHPVVVDRSRDREAKVSFSVRDKTLEKDFHLYYSASDENIGMNVVTYRPDAGAPGYFMMLLSPRSRLQAERVVERDLVFVVDTSGSMQGEKIRQARNALRHCVTHLNEGDRFALVRFSTDVYVWEPRLVSAAKERREGALRWVDGLTAQGGTDIAGALDRALSFARDPARPFFVVFLTDGKPTIGRTIDTGEILADVKRVASKSAGTTRIFTWGVGYDVDTQLLDGIAVAAGGVSEYVRPEEDIAAKVTSFYNRTSHPLLTDMSLELEGGEIVLQDMHPRTVPDLYAGTQVVLLGRYTGDGDVSVRLTGQVNEATERFAYATSFPRSAGGNEFVELLWARRRVGYLLDAIRLDGEKKEIVDEVIRLSMRYGIQTPYTSYLILEDGTQVAAGGTVRGARGRRALANGLAVIEEHEDVAQKLSRYALRLADRSSAGRPATAALERQREHNEVARSLAEGFARNTGKSAVDAASYLKRLKETPRADRRAELARFRRSAGTRFFLYRGLWVDERFKADDVVTPVKFGSSAYFRLLRRQPKLVGAFKIAPMLVYVTAPGKAVVVAPNGRETLTDEQIGSLFKP